MKFLVLPDQMMGTLGVTIAATLLVAAIAMLGASLLVATPAIERLLRRHPANDNEAAGARAPHSRLRGV